MDAPASFSNNKWKILTSFSKEQIDAGPQGLYNVQPSYYMDVNGKEWMILLLPEYRRPDKQGPIEHDSYLYDFENDKVIPFVHDYEKEIYKRFNIGEEKIVAGVVNATRRSVIDTDNHIMYWVLHRFEISKTPKRKVVRYAIIASFDIKDLHNVKLIYQTKISQDKFPKFVNDEYTMLIVGDTIQFVLGGKVDSRSAEFNNHIRRTPSDGGLMHYEFNVKTKKLRLVHENIHSKYIDHIEYKNVVNLFSNLKIGDWIDARDRCGHFYMSQVVDIKDEIFDQDNNNDDDDGDGNNITTIGNNNKRQSMKIEVSFQGLGDEYNEWIDVSKNICVTEYTQADPDLVLLESKNDGGDDDRSRLLTSLCDCQGYCHFSQQKYKNEKEFNKYHRIALLKCQSMRYKGLKQMKALYSKSEKKMIILGRNGSTMNLLQKQLWSGLYYKRINYDCKDYQLFIEGFIHRLFITFPKDLIEMIFKYYYIPNDDEWTQATKTNKNGVFIRDMYGNISDHFRLDAGCVLVNNDKDVFMFGGKQNKTQREMVISNVIFKLDIENNILTRLSDIQCSPMNKKALWHAIYCQKSKRVHIFDKQFSLHASISLQVLNNAASVVVDQ